jgi:hypothetical protein
MPTTTLSDVGLAVTLEMRDAADDAVDDVVDCETASVASGAPVDAMVSLLHPATERENARSADITAAPLLWWENIEKPSEGPFGGSTGIATHGRRSLVALRHRLSPGLPLSRSPPPRRVACALLMTVRVSSREDADHTLYPTDDPLKRSVTTDALTDLASAYGCTKLLISGDLVLGPLAALAVSPRPSSRPTLICHQQALLSVTVIT